MGCQQAVIKTDLYEGAYVQDAEVVCWRYDDVDENSMIQCAPGCDCKPAALHRGITPMYEVVNHHQI